VPRPKFTTAWNAFNEIKIPVAMVAEKLGGKVKQNVDAEIFVNTCPIRMSYVLNKAGFPIRSGVGYSVVSGADRSLYLFRVNEMMEYLKRTFGKPDKTIRSPQPADFEGSQGIIVIKGHGWRNARGHVTLWNGAKCSDSCHLLNDPDNGSFVPETGSIWYLP
jgi:hypothetical protein